MECKATISKDLEGYKLVRYMSFFKVPEFVQKVLLED